uniref:Uncharacterized protein n=2 Tax=Arion vulgaris TaxID=1028688 RepID=A0A0B7A8T6_9EUPU
MVKLVGLDDTMWRWPQALDSEKNLIDRRGVCTRQLYTAPVAEMLERSNALKLVSKGLSSPSELIVQGNIRNAEKFHSFWTHSSLPAFYFDGNEEGCISTWTSCIIFYRRLYMFGESKIFVYNYVTKAPRKICLKTKIYGLKSLVFNEKRIVALCEAQTICVIPNIASEKPVEVFKDKLRTEATKIKMVGDMVIVLFYDGILETSQVVTDENNMVSFTKWHVLMGQNAECFPGYVNAITDFDIQGQLFSAILANGEMFLSHFESLDHDSLERNVHSHFKIPITFDASYLTRMTMDVDGDIKLAVVETLGYAPLAQLHMLYADK